MSRDDARWVTVSIPDGVAKCHRCGATLHVELPIDLNNFVEALRQFGGQHAQCREGR